MHVLECIGVDGISTSEAIGESSVGDADSKKRLRGQFVVVGEVAGLENC